MDDKDLFINHHWSHDMLPPRMATNNSIVLVFMLIHRVLKLNFSSLWLILLSPMLIFLNEIPRENVP